MKSYTELPPDSSARVYLTVPIHESDDARMLGCKWDHKRNSWWVDRNSIAPYVWHWMDDAEPLKAEVRAKYRALERVNRRKSRRNQRNRRITDDARLTTSKPPVRR